MLYFVSPELGRIKGLRKRNGLTATVPDFTRDEMFAIAPLVEHLQGMSTAEQTQYIDNEVIFRFAGCVRALFYGKKWMAMREQTQNNELKSLCKEADPVPDPTTLSKRSHTVIALVPDRDGFFEPPKIRFLSQKVVRQINIDASLRRMIRLKEIYAFSGDLNPFELLCHHVIPRGGKFKARRLLTDEEQRNKQQNPDVCLQWEKCGVSLGFKNIREANKAVNCYYYPMQPNFSTFDAVVPALRITRCNSTTSVAETITVMCQYTKARTHDIVVEGAWGCGMHFGILTNNGPIDVTRWVQPNQKMRFFIIVPEDVYPYYVNEQKFVFEPSKTKKKVAEDERNEKKIKVLHTVTEQWVLTSNHLQNLLVQQYLSK